MRRVHRFRFALVTSILFLFGLIGLTGCSTNNIPAPTDLAAEQQIHTAVVPILDKEKADHPEDLATVNDLETSWTNLLTTLQSKYGTTTTTTTTTAPTATPSIPATVTPAPPATRP